MAPGPHAEEEKSVADYEELLIKQAIDRATEECSNDMPLTLQLLQNQRSSGQSQEAGKSRKSQENEKRRTNS